MSDTGPRDPRPGEGTAPPSPPAPDATGQPWGPPPAQQGYVPPSPYGAAPPGAAARNGLGVAALVLGIVGLFFAVVFFPLGFVLAVVGLGLGIAGLRRASRGEATNRGMSLTGIVLSVLALLVCIGWVVAIAFIVDKTEECDDPSLSRAEQRTCVEEKLGG